MKQPDQELRRLTDHWHAGTITPEDALHLERRLLENEAACRYFFEISAIEAALPEAAAVPVRKMAIPFQPIQPKPKTRILWWAVAAAFVAGIFIGPMLRPSGSSVPVVSQPETPAATVTGMLGVSWESPPQSQWLSLVAGGESTRIGTGLIELTFASGTRTVIEGPASFRVLGDNSMELARGRLVADVPKGAEGFDVAYAGGRIVDLGTEFGVEVDNDGRSANFGVFRGEIEFHPQAEDGRSIRLLENHAIAAKGDKILSIPFDRDKYTRTLPSREFAWRSHGERGPQVWDYDISHLVWTPGRYRVICKWMQGDHGVLLRGAELLVDGQPVADDRHEGFAGQVKGTRRNIYDFSLAPESYRRGRWTLRLHAEADVAPGQSGESAGVVLVEERNPTKVTDSDFIGTWEYLHNGIVYRRIFLPDGTARMTKDGQDYPGFQGSSWKTENGVLILTLVDSDGDRLHEKHLLRDSKTLIFTNRPYRNASRVEEN